MSTEVKFRRGSTTQHATFTGAQGEVTVDTDLNTLRIHDGATVGGHRALLHSEFVGTGTGTVTQIDSGTGLTGGPVTASGTLSLDPATQTTLTNAQTAYSWGDHSLYSYLTNITTQNLNNLFNVNDANITDGQILHWVHSLQQYQPVNMPTGGSGGGVSVFTLLTDTPSSFSNQANKLVRVNAGATALEFVENLGEANLASNKGAGEGHIFYAKDIATGDLQFRSLRDGANITITEDANEITIDAANISYTAGTGLDLTNNEFSIETGYVKNTGAWTMSGEITFANNVIFQNQLTFGATLSVEHPSNTEKEVFIRGKVSDATNDFIELSNASTSTSSLSPAVRGGCDSTPALPGMSVIGEISTAKDTGLFSVMEFLVRKGSDITDYTYGTPTGIQTRPLFDWKNNDTSVMVIKPTGLEVENGLTVTGNITTANNVKFKNSFSLKSGLESAIDATVYPGCVGVANNELYFSVTSNGGEWLKVAKTNELPTGVFETITADTGGTKTATTVNDTLTFAGGTGIDTALNTSTNTITITNTGTGSGGGSAQDIWKTISADSGSAIANSSEDAFTIAGGAGITTAISGDTLTVSGSASDIFKTISVSGQDNVVASGVSDALTFVAGSNVTITTDATAQTVTVNSTATGGGSSSTLAFGTISVAGNADIVADAAPDILTFVGGTGINVSTDPSADQITITNSAQASTAFTSIAVASQTNIVADSASDTLTIAAGSNVTVTTDASTDTLTIAAAAITQDTYQNIAVASQSTLTANESSDTLTLVAGAGISIVTSTSNDSVTITNSEAGGYESKTFASRTFFVQTPLYHYVMSNTDFAVDDIAVTGNNLATNPAVSPTVYLIGGHTYCFNLDVTGHPFYIKTATGEGQVGSTNEYNVGLKYWNPSTETWTTGTNAQGKVSGLLFWTVPQVISGNYIYQCGSHGNMNGILKIIDITSL